MVRVRSGVQSSPAAPLRNCDPSTVKEPLKLLADQGFCASPIWVIFALSNKKLPKRSRERCRITYRERPGNILPVCGDGVGMERKICSPAVLAVLAVVAACRASAALSFEQPLGQMLAASPREHQVDVALRTVFPENQSGVKPASSDPLCEIPDAWISANRFPSTSEFPFKQR